MSEIKLYNDDCLKVMGGVADKSVDFICTDIPYELENHGGTKSALAKRSAKVRDSVEFMAHGIDYDKVFSEFIRICKIPNMIIFCSNLQVGKIISYFNERNLKTDVLVWEKSNPAPLCNGKYISDLEYIIYVHTKGSCFNNNTPFNYKKKCKIYPIVTDENKVHPTQKPLKLIEEFVALHSLENEIVMDAFMGSGTCGIICKKLNRNFIGCEIDKKYFDIAKTRIENDGDYFVKDNEDNIFNI